jgi:Phytanoyl-CoA dioxygenase (PhyH)
MLKLFFVAIISLQCTCESFQQQFTQSLRIRNSHRTIYGRPSSQSFLYATRDQYMIEDEDEGVNDEEDLRKIASHEEEVLAIARGKHEKETINLQAPTKCSKVNCQEALLTDGVVRIDKVTSEGLANSLARFITDELERSIKEVESGKVDVFERFSALLSNSNRWDLKLPIGSVLGDKGESIASVSASTSTSSTVIDDSSIVMMSLKEIFRKDGVLGPTLANIMGDKCELFELAAFYTATGAPRQVLHADTLWTKTPALFTCTVALQDVTEDMGPTLFIPGSFTKEMHKKFDSEDVKVKDGVLLKNPHKLSTLSIGDAAVYDSRVLHCGTPNKSEKSRILFYATFRNPKGPGKDSDFWNVASIRPEYVGKFKLKDFLS